MTLKYYFHIFGLIILFVLSEKTNAQAMRSVLHSLSVVHNNDEKKLDIKLTSIPDISNLLVVVANSGGKIMFLENQCGIKGSYQVIINTEGYERGQYTLKITADNEKNEKTFMIK